MMYGRSDALIFQEDLAGLAPVQKVLRTHPQQNTCFSPRQVSSSTKHILSAFLIGVPVFKYTLRYTSVYVQYQLD